MGQKCSDFETIPLNTLYHWEQHRIGFKRFARTYELDIPALLAMLNEKPYISTLLRHTHQEHPPHVFLPEPVLYYVANYTGEFMRLAPVRDGLPKSMAILKDRVRESLSARILARVKQFQAR